MFIVMILIGFGIASLLSSRGTLLEETTAAIEPAEKRIKATVDGKPVESYIVEE